MENFGNEIIFFLILFITNYLLYFVSLNSNYLCCRCNINLYVAFLAFGFFVFGKSKRVCTVHCGFGEKRTKRKEKKRHLLKLQMIRLGKKILLYYGIVFATSFFYIIVCSVLFRLFLVFSVAICNDQVQNIDESMGT